MSGIVEIARLTGVSAKTVARILNGECRRSKNRERILACADRMGYVRNIPAATLRTGRAPLIAVVIMGDSSTADPTFLHALDAALRAEGHMMILAWLGPEDADIMETASQLQALRVSGIIVWAGPERSGKTLTTPFKHLHQAGKPMVAVCSTETRIPSDRIILKAGRQLKPPGEHRHQMVEIARHCVQRVFFRRAHPEAKVWDIKRISG